MDSFGFHNIKVEKGNAMFWYRRLQKITAMVRLIELCIFLIVLSWFTAQLPIAFKLSGEYFRGFSFTAVSPRFVFIIGNAIVIVLVLKSGQLSSKDSDTKSNSKRDFYDEYVENCEKNRTSYIHEFKKQRKHSNSAVISDPYSPKENKIHRTHSENLKRMHHQGDAGRDLRWSVTKIRQKSVDSEEKPVVNSYSEDEMSSEEFRRTVEAFIARQQRFSREEEFSSTVSFQT